MGERSGGDGTGERPRLVVVGSLGVGQILVWGASYYFPAVLAGPTSVATGWPIGWVIGALSVGLLVSGLASPTVGRVIDRLGGRPVLAASAVLLAAGLLLAGVASSLPVFYAGWLVIGLAMAAGLYDPAFSTLGRLYGDRARSAITQLTLFGGFSSTICWPLSAWLAHRAGWRGAYLAYAAISLLIILPTYLIGLPREPAAAHATPATDLPPIGAVRAKQRAAFVLLAAGLTLASFIMTVIAVELLALLGARGVSLAAAVGFGALVGPSQVGARLLESVFGRQRHPVWTMIASTILVAVGIGTLLLGSGLVAAGLVLYGAGSGIRSIAQGTVPLALFGRAGYAALMGRLALPKLIAQAAAPSVGTYLLARFGPDALVSMLCAASLVNVGLALALLPFARARGGPG